MAAVAALMWRDCRWRGASCRRHLCHCRRLRTVGWAGLNSTSSALRRPRVISERMAAWRDTVQIIEGFLGGVGWAATARRARLSDGPRDVQYLQAHNDYLQLAAEGGLIVGLPAAFLLRSC